MLVKHNFFHNTSDNNHLSWATATLARQRIATRRAISSFDTELEESRVLGRGDARGHWAGRRAPADWALKVELPPIYISPTRMSAATRLHFDRYSEIQQKITNKDFMKNHEFSWRNKIPKKIWTSLQYIYFTEPECQHQHFDRYSSKSFFKWRF